MDEDEERSECSQYLKHQENTMRLGIGVLRTGIWGPITSRLGTANQISLDLGELLLRVALADVPPEQQEQRCACT